MRFVKFAVTVIVVLVIAMSYGFFCNNPRMKEQPHIRTYQAMMPDPPENSVPTTNVSPPLPTSRQAQDMKNPLEASAENVKIGRLYYTYYCIQCHGDRGYGDGQVGDSFIPKPVSLRSQRVEGMSDGQLLRAMLTGPGHSPLRTKPEEQRPVLEYIVLPDQRWHVVLYVRSLGQQ